MQPPVIDDRHSQDAGQKIMECLDEALSKYGESVSEVIFYNFEKKRNLPRNEIAAHPICFEKLLDSIFGVGSSLIKESIIRELESSLVLHKQCTTIEEAFSEAMKIEIKEIARKL